MAGQPAGRVALMSIQPEFAAQILAGTKHVEFRKRRLADDVTHVVVYASAPVSAVVGAFRVTGQDTSPPRDLWDRFAEVAGICRTRYSQYFDGHDLATGILVSGVRLTDVPVPLRDIGLDRPPQSFQYLLPDVADRLLTAMEPVRVPA